MTGNMTALQSFPRCGSTLLRRLIDEVTGVYSGTDMSAFHEQMLGLIGQGHVSDDDTVWITKTHFPFGTERAVKFNA